MHWQELAVCAPHFTERCAGEGELVPGLTKPGMTLPNASRGVNLGKFFGSRGGAWPALKMPPPTWNDEILLFQSTAPLGAWGLLLAREITARSSAAKNHKPRVNRPNLRGRRGAVVVGRIRDGVNLSRGSLT